MFSAAEIDFCDEFGRIAKIGSLKNWEYATETLKPQLTYVVIAFQSISVSMTHHYLTSHFVILQEPKPGNVKAYVRF